MQNYSRRDFIKTAVLGTAGLSFSAASYAKIVGANSDIRVAQIGFHSQGAGHIATLKGIKGVRIVGLCDVDKHVLDGKLKQLGAGVQGYSDIRKLLENKDLDAVSIAVPNHWHALATVWACQAGKDVYVEKPVSHNLWEGRKMVEAARKYKRIVQAGTQCRSSVGLQAAVQYVQSGKLGKIKVARGFCYKARKSIGKVEGPQQVPDFINYDLWSGPREVEAPRRNGANGPVHYDWHWFWNYGNGDLGNQGPHQVDICRWFLGENEIAPYAMAVGGRLGYEDSAETPNTVVMYQGYKIPMIFEVRGLPTSKASQTAGWKMDNYKGASIGCVIECEGGYVVVPSYTEAFIYDNQGKQIKKFTGAADVKGLPGLTASSGGHHQNWIDCIRTRKRKNLHAEVLEGHLSAGLVHTSNISYRLGATQQPEAIKEKLQDNKGLAEATERMFEHLKANGVDLAKTPVTLGVPLKVDPKKECFVDNAEADKLLTEKYRKEFSINL